MCMTIHSNGQISEAGTANLAKQVLLSLVSPPVKFGNANSSPTTDVILFYEYLDTVPLHTKVCALRLVVIYLYSIPNSLGR